MTLEEYFDQGEYYFSESAQEMVPLETLPYPHLFNACQKLYEEHMNEFRDSRLWNAFMERLSPSQEKIRRDLRQYGKASCVYWQEVEGSVRSRFYHAAKALGVRVKTHKEKNWITATVVDAGVAVRVKGRNVAS